MTQVKAISIKSLAYQVLVDAQPKGRCKFCGVQSHHKWADNRLNKEVGTGQMHPPDCTFFKLQGLCLLLGCVEGGKPVVPKSSPRREPKPRKPKAATK